MGNKDSTVEKKEEILLNLSGLQVGKEIEIVNVKINFLGENYIHTIICGDKSKEILVILHGFGGSSVMNYKILKELSEIYLVYCIDLLGMGLSSRPRFTCTTTRETIDFFIDSLEQWRISLGIENFILAGHSFGGYMACQYSVKYTDTVKKLFLMSPVGFTKADSEFDYEKAKNQKMTFWERRFFNLRMDFFLGKMTVSKVRNKFYCLIPFIAKRALSKRLKISSENAELLFNFISETYKLPDEAQLSLHYIINPNVIAYLSLEESIETLELPIVCFFGDRDWMNDTGAKRVSYSNPSFKLIYIKDSGHQITMENPTELVSHLISS
jgi:pimeloyl-ACP methyl ester carboxylesterase